MNLTGTLWTDKWKNEACEWIRKIQSYERNIQDTFFETWHSDLQFSVAAIMTYPRVYDTTTTLKRWKASRTNLIALKSNRETGQPTMDLDTMVEGKRW